MKKTFFLAGVLFFMIFSLFLQIQKPPLIPREILFGNPAQAGPQISPDGKKIAFLAPEQGVLNIWLQNRGEKKKRVVTQDRDRGIRTFFWASDSRHFLFLQDEKGNENTHLFKVDSENGTVSDLTPFENVRVQVLQTDKEMPDHLLISMNRENPQAFDVYRLNWKTGLFDLAEKNPGNVSRWITDSRLRVLGKVTSDEQASYHVWVRQDEKDEWIKSAGWNLEDNLSCGVIGFSKDTRHLYLIDSRETATGRLVKLEWRTGAIEVLAEDDTADVMQAVVNPDSREVEKVLFMREQYDWMVLSDSIRRDIEIIESAHGKNFSIISRDDADQIWIIRVEQDARSPAYFLYDRGNRKSTFLFEQYPALKKYSLAKTRSIHFKSRDGLILHGYLTLPLNSAGKLPLVVKVHGGPWSRDSWGYDPRVQWLANRGYAVLQVNFRGSTSYGKSFLNAGNKEWGAAMQDDLTDAVQWAVQEGIAEASRVAIYGASYGGYAALAGAALTPDLYQAAVSVVGPSNLESLIQSIPPYWTTELANIHLRIGDPEQDGELLKSRSPLYSAEKIRIPMLIAQGANDPRVPKRESDQIVEALKRHGVPYEYLVFEDEGHGFAKPENQMKFFSAMEVFLGKYLGGRVEA